MIIVRDRQKWVCVKTKRAGMMVRIVGLWRGAEAGTMCYRKVSGPRSSIGKITARELRRNWRLVSCEHEDLGADCVSCTCAFHGDSGCTCSGMRSW